jgi:DNA-3-methyladenine glycosylase II
VVEVLARRGDIDLDLLQARLHHGLALDADMSSFYAHAAHDPTLAATVRSLHGMQILRTDSLFEAVAITVIEQQIALKAAQRAERWLVERYGEHLEYAGRRYYVFPTAERLAGLKAADLTPLKITFGRIERLLSIARAQADGSLDLERGWSEPERIYQTLISLHGVGHWTAAWSMIRAMGVFMYVGSADVALRSAVNYCEYGRNERASREDTDAYFARYGAFSGLASVYTLMRWEMQRHPALD